MEAQTGSLNSAMDLSRLVPDDNSYVQVYKDTSLVSLRRTLARSCLYVAGRCRSRGEGVLKFDSCYTGSLQRLSGTIYAASHDTAACYLALRASHKLGT